MSKNSHSASNAPVAEDTTSPNAAAQETKDGADSLLESHAKYEAIGKTQAIVEFDMDGTILTANANFLGILGYSLEEVQGQSHAMFVGSEEAGSADYKGLWAKLNRGESEAVECPLVASGGEGLWASVTYSPVLNLEGKPTKVVQLITDITAERDERQQGSLAVSAIQSSATASMRVDLDLNITDANPATINLLRDHLETFQAAYPSVDFDNLLGTNLDIFHKNPAMQRKILGDPRNLPHKAEIAIGDLAFRLSISAMTDDDGKHIGANLEWHDITNELILQKRNADYTGQIEAISKAQAVIEFNMDGTIRGANENFLGTLGYRLDEIVGKHHRMFVEESYANSPQYQDFWAQLNRGEGQSNEYLQLGKGGKELWIQASYNPILDMNGDPSKIVKYASDITMQKALAAEQAQKDQETGRFVTEMAGVLAEVVRQDLTARMTGEYDGDHAVTMDNLNSALHTLDSALSQVSGVSAQISSASSQISEGSQQLAIGASTQASSIEEISASLEQMSSMTSQNADNAQEAKTLASEAQGSAVRGDEQMAKLKQAIDAIKESSDQTAKIVKTIDVISFQTNMLALNAAVEAARAGDAGKGFAVVAEEVRSLAQRSAEAAKSTAELIEGSSSNVENGVAITEGVQAILTEINDGSTKVMDLITEIAAASKEQAEGITQVNGAVDGMNRVIQENAANSEQSSAAANQLNGQVSELTDLIGEFDLSPNEMATAAPSHTPAPAPRTAKAPARPAVKRPSAPSSEAFPLDDGDLSEF